MCQIKISIIIATKNRLKLLNNLLVSFSQYNTYKNYEIIIVDDNSINKKNLEKMIFKFNLNIKTYFLTKNCFQSYARNYGFEKSRGSILFFIDDDSMFIEDILPKISKIFETTNNEFVISGKNIGDSNKYSIIWSIIDNYNRLIFANPFFIKNLFHKQKRIKYATSSNMILKSKTFEKFKFDNSIHIREDWEISKRISNQNIPIFFEKKIILIHKKNFQNLDSLIKNILILKKNSQNNKFIKQIINISLIPIFLTLASKKIYLYPYFLKIIFKYETINNF